MRICRKCSKQVSDGSKICRDCGAILEDMPDEAVPVAAQPEPTQASPGDEQSVGEFVVDSEYRHQRKSLEHGQGTER